MRQGDPQLRQHYFLAAVSVIKLLTLKETSCTCRQPRKGRVHCLPAASVTEELWECMLTKENRPTDLNLALPGTKLWQSMYLIQNRQLNSYCYPNICLSVWLTAGVFPVFVFSGFTLVTDTDRWGKFGWQVWRNLWNWPRLYFSMACVCDPQNQ